MTPFFLKGKSQNIIRQEELNGFIAIAPELAPYMKAMPPKLCLLQLSFCSSLCCWVISQQISSIAAERLIQRFQTHFPAHHSPLDLIELDVAALRKIGLTEAKAKTIIRLGQHLEQKKIAPEELAQLESKAVRELLLEVKGIGPWTADMHLIFNQGAMDINGSTDLVVRKGLRELYQLNDTPSIKQAYELTSHWAEYATVGTLLCWNIMEPENA